MGSDAAGRYYTDDKIYPVPPNAPNYNKTFVEAIQRVKRRHDPVVTTMAQGINELKEHENFTVIPSEIQTFLDRFHLSRIGIRMVGLLCDRGIGD